MHGRLAGIPIGLLDAAINHGTFQIINGWVFIVSLILVFPLWKLRAYANRRFTDAKKQLEEHSPQSRESK